MAFPFTCLEESKYLIGYLFMFYYRIGRTGRFGRSGYAINFVDGTRSMNNLKEIERHFGRSIHKLDTEDFDQLEQALSS